MTPPLHQVENNNLLGTSSSQYIILNIVRGARGDLGQSDDLHPGHYWLCCGSGQCLEVPIPGSEKWRR